MTKAPLIIHAGYPKTGTTTFQKHVFPHHREIDYLGKFIPSFDFVKKDLYPLINDLTSQSKINYRGSYQLSCLVSNLCKNTERKCVLISTEAFIHPMAIDIAIIADRLKEAFNPCKILITIREQISALLSFYWMHGQYGQYLSIGAKKEGKKLEYPLNIIEWIRLQKSHLDRNLLGSLHYDAVIKYYIKKFGYDNVKVLLYEEFKNKPDTYADNLGTFLGVDVGRLQDLMAGKHEFISNGRSVPWYKNSFIELAALLDNRGPFSKAIQLFSSKHADDLRGRLEDEIISLENTYRAGNAWLSSALSLPVEQYGYSL
ncbi:MAG: hypothetical protein K9L19_13290 [Desulfarculaceae bacterium]|nr:hypothetical protein [Desulfarculaceae bacterium]MCF8122401.1 hypothetical protein [Desulfarculaceae bacterium]